MYLEGKRRSRAEGCVQGRWRAGEPMAAKKSSALVIFTQSSESRLSTWRYVNEGSWMKKRGAW